MENWESKTRCHLLGYIFIIYLAGDRCHAAFPELDTEKAKFRQTIEERLVSEFQNSVHCQDTKEELDKILQGRECSSKPKSRTITYNTSFFHQLFWVLKRGYRNLMLNPQTSIAQVHFWKLITYLCLTGGTVVKVLNVGNRIMLPITFYHEATFYSAESFVCRIPEYL